MTSEGRGGWPGWPGDKSSSPDRVSDPYCSCGHDSLRRTSARHNGGFSDPTDQSRRHPLSHDGIDADLVYQAAFDAVESLHVKESNVCGIQGSSQNGDYTSHFIGHSSNTKVSDYQEQIRQDSLHNGITYSNDTLKHVLPSSILTTSSHSVPLSRPIPPNSLPVISIVERDLDQDHILQKSISASTGENSPTNNFDNFSSKVNSLNSSFYGFAPGDDLHESELTLKRKKAFIERVIEQHENLSEQKRRNDIIQLCEKLQSSDFSVKPLHKSSRIKTNGSLPREKCSSDSPVTSPIKSFSSSDDIHLLKLSDGGYSRPHNVAVASSKPVPHYENVPLNPCAEDAGLALQLLGLSTQQTPSNYFDTCPTPPSSVPGSPRRGIKTVLSPKDSFSFPQEITHEVVENRLDLPDVDRRSHRPPKDKTNVSSSKEHGKLRTGQTLSDVLHLGSSKSKKLNVEEKRFILPLGDKQHDLQSPRKFNSKNPKFEALSERDSGVPASPTHDLSDRVMALSLELEFVLKERLKIMSAMTVFKARLTEIENQQEESDRDMAMEQAFINAELKSKAEKVRHQRSKIFSLQERADKFQIELELWQENRNKQQNIYMISLEDAELELRRLQESLELCEGETSRNELKERIYLQADVVETEKKNYEDLEFKYLEEESVWLAKKEELNRELTDSIKKYEDYVAVVSQLESWVEPMDEFTEEQENYSDQKIAYMRRLEEGQSQLDVLDARMKELVKQGAVTLSPSQNTNGDSNEDDSFNDISLGELDGTSLTGDLLSSTAVLSFSNASSNNFHHDQRQVPLDDSFCKTSAVKEDCTPPDEMSEVEKENTTSNQRSSTNLSSSVCSRLYPDEDSLQNSVVDLQSRTDLDSDDQQHCAASSSQSSCVADTVGSVRRRDTQRQQQRPLTRYLPIRAASLDLRRHIESAGHSVELCGEVQLDSTSCRGVLHKASARFRTWQKRWFVFDRATRTLSYYKSRRDERPRGGIAFQSIAEVYVDHVSSHRNTNANCVFVVKTRERAFHLMAPTAEAMRIWVDVIFTGAEGYQEFDFGS